MFSWVSSLEGAWHLAPVVLCIARNIGFDDLPAGVQNVLAGIVGSLC